MTRKKDNKTKGFLYMVVIFVVAAIVFAILIELSPDADAISRSEIQATETKIIKLEKQIDEWTDKIKDKNIQINDAKKTVDLEKEQYRETKAASGKSWKALQNVQKEFDDIAAAENKVKERRNELSTLITERSDKIKEKKALELQLIQDREQLIIENRVDLSHLTKLVGVYTSKSCQTIIESGLNSTCPTYKNLVTLDSSETNVSGKFTTDDDGFFHRGNSNYQDEQRWYDDDEQIRIIIDPSQSMIDRIKTVEIRPNFNNYFVTEDMTLDDKYELIDVEIEGIYSNTTKAIQVSNQTQEFGMVIYHDRFIDKCKRAIINADKWELLLPDTINHLRNDCTPESTSFTEREIIIQNKTEYRHEDSVAWNELKSWQEKAEYCIFKYKACT